MEQKHFHSALNLKFYFHIQINAALVGFFSKRNDLIDISIIYFHSTSTDVI